MPEKTSHLPEGLKGLALEWDMAITAVDRHSGRCRECSKRRHSLAIGKATGTLVSVDPYRLCNPAIQLYETECERMTAYRAAGGSLPVRLP
jgi:hypothetical protein